VVSVTDPYGNIFSFLELSRYYFFQVAPQLYSRGWVDPVRDPLLLRKSGSAGNRTRTSRSVARKLYVKLQTVSESSPRLFIRNKVQKVNVFLWLSKYILRHESLWGNWCIDPRVLDLGISWRWDVSFTPRQPYPWECAPSTHWIEGWVDPRSGLDGAEKWKILTLPGLELRFFGRPGRRQSLYLYRTKHGSQDVSHITTFWLGFNSKKRFTCLSEAYTSHR
jgi:hypothetical protein